ncbi:MAG: dephospho-CoA kinase [Saprospiraceae bacterium]|nr:dephospho-CoA kinase [Saprospiraceae bacterium]
MLRIGITGGIGSGKSTVTRIFGVLGIPVYDSDRRAKQLMSSDPALRTALIDAFGVDIFPNDGELDRRLLARIVFDDQDQLARLNALVHPAVGADFERWCRSLDAAPYVLKEAALIFEAGIDRHLDRTILVWAPEDLRIQRVIERDQTTEEAVRARMRNQWPDARKVAGADFVIVNDGAHPLIRQVLEVHHLLLRSARSASV